MFEGLLYRETCDLLELPSVDVLVVVNDRDASRDANLVLVCVSSEVGTLDLDAIRYDCLP
jgi:hypothetical protein